MSAEQTTDVVRHTRTSTDAGPDFCSECSAAIREWVSWPCAGSDAATVAEYCPHSEVLDRPESDTWECLVCGYEGAGSQ